MMKKFLVLGLLTICVLSAGTALPQQANTSASAKLETIFQAAEMPFVKLGADHYKAVVTIDTNESDSFQVFLQTIGNDPNDADLQIMQMVFFLGALPKGTAPPIALVKQINEWNSCLSRGSIFIVEGVIVYQSSAWLLKSDATTLTNDALVGHFTSQKLRKDVELYLKQ
jgi:hypothetical protein